MKKKHLPALIIVVCFGILCFFYLQHRSNRSSVQTAPRDTNIQAQETGGKNQNLTVSQKAKPVIYNKQIPVPPDIKKITDRGKLIVGIYYKDMPPFFMVDGKGNLYGVDISIGKDIANLLNVDVEFDRRATTYQQLFEEVASGEVDMVASKFSRTFERSKYIKFSRPYVVFRKALILNKVEATKYQIEDYPMDYLRTASFKIGVMAKTSYVEFAKELFKNATIVEYEDWEHIVDAVLKGEILAGLHDEDEAVRLVRQKPDTAVYTSIFILKDQKDCIAIGVPYQSTQFLDWINEYLETYDVNKDVQDLIKEYPECYKEKE